MKAILALGVAAALSGCAYNDPYVDNYYYGASPGYYGTAPYVLAPQPYYYGYGAVAPFGYRGYGFYDYPSVYPAYPWVGPRVRPHPHGRRPDARAPSDSGDRGTRPSRPGRGSGGGDRRPGVSGGGGSGWEPGVDGVDPGALGGGGSGYVPNQPTVK
jgi:hypothetical protein